MNNILGEEKIHILFLKFGIPAVIAMLISASQTIIDGIFLGKIIGPHAMAGVSIVNPYMNLVTGSSFMVGIGAMSIIGRRLGCGDIKRAQDTFRSAQVLILFISIIITVIGCVFASSIAKLLGADEELMQYSVIYLRILICFAPFVTFLIIFGLTSRMIEKPSLYLKATVIALIGNIILNTIFIGLLGWEMIGAALATGIAQVIGFIVVVIPMLQKKNVLNLFEGKIDYATISPMLYNGSSEAVVSMSAALTTYLFNITFMKISGADGVAAFTIINYMIVFGTMLMFGISDGIGAIISFNYGSGRLDRVKKIMGLSLACNLVVGFLLFLTLLFQGENLVRIFSKENEEIIKMSSLGARIIAVAFLMNGISIIFSGYFTSIGKPLESIIIALSRGCIFIVIGIIVLPMLFEMYGVWLVIPFAEIVTLIIGMYLMKKDSKILYNKK